MFKFTATADANDATVAAMRVDAHKRRDSVEFRPLAFNVLKGTGHAQR